MTSRAPGRRPRARLSRPTSRRSGSPIAPRHWTPGPPRASLWGSGPGPSQGTLGMPGSAYRGSRFNGRF